MATVAVVSVKKKKPTVVDETSTDIKIRREANAIRKSSDNIQHILDNYTFEVKR